MKGKTQPRRAAPAQPVRFAPGAAEIAILANRVERGDVVTADLNDGSFTLLMDELKRRGFQLATRTASEQALNPFLFKVKK
jgi:hypothetical protein